VYTIRVEATFSATHSLKMPDGSDEPIHGHDWRVSVFIASRELDPLGMVVDFEKVQSALRTVLEPLHHSDLNQLEPFANLNPTAEIVARHLFDEIGKLLPRAIQRVELVEAPGCVAIYEK
jgi:6-pyruvoyltetrahydropterin/6-carboxytetrahydropterin synthase